MSTICKHCNGKVEHGSEIVSVISGTYNGSNHSIDDVVNSVIMHPECYTDWKNKKNHDKTAPGYKSSQYKTTCHCCGNPIVESPIITVVQTDMESFENHIFGINIHAHCWLNIAGNHFMPIASKDNNTRDFCLVCNEKVEPNTSQVVIRYKGCTSCLVVHKDCFETAAGPGFWNRNDL